MIVPTVGRIVLFRPDGPNGATHVAIVCGVNGDTNVNLSVFGLYGEGPTSRSSIHLKQDESETPPAPYAEWMPYQIGQAKASGGSPGGNYGSGGGGGTGLQPNTPPTT